MKNFVEVGLDSAVLVAEVLGFVPAEDFDLGVILVFAPMDVPGNFQEDEILLQAA